MRTTIDSTQAKSIVDAGRGEQVIVRAITQEELDDAMLGSDVKGKVGAGVELDQVRLSATLINRGGAEVDVDWESSQVLRGADACGDWDWSDFEGGPC